MSKRTPLFETHVARGGKMVDFAGWEMPLNYGSQIAEHNAVRSSAGMFDVSHMTVIDVQGPSALDFLRTLVANDVATLDVGRALYGALLNDAGGVIDDLIVYRLEAGYRCVVNAATRDKVLDWFHAHRDAGAQFEEQDLAMVAVQGPGAIDAFERATGRSGIADIEPFSARLEEAGGVADGWMIARTGYTGEDGVEVILPGAAAPDLWEALAAAGVADAGLAARDTLRLEAGLNLYGQDMTEETLPLQANLGWTISWEPADRHFIGRAALEQARQAGLAEKLTGLVMEGKGVLRHGQQVVTEAGPGVITSGIFSPTLGYSIALARVPRAARGACHVDVRGRQQPARIVRTPFVRRGRQVFKET